MYDFDKVFPRYTDYNPQVPVWCLTNGNGCYTHRFFDTVPISPSGKYLAVLDLPYEDKPAKVGDSANVVVINLLTGEEKIVAQTYGWETQLGANINWGEDDTKLIFNDVDINTYEDFAVCLNFKTGEKKRLGHSIYHVSHDGKTGVCSNMTSMRKSQFGYGVMVPDEKLKYNTIFTEDDGIWTVDIESGEATLVLSIKSLFEQCYTPLQRKHLKDGLTYCFHTKFSPDDKKIMFSTRHIRAPFKDEFNVIANAIKPSIVYCVYTCNKDGSDPQICIDSTQWCKGGHHSTWSPDSQYITMNLNIENTGLRLCRASLKGRNIEKLSEKNIGSGHPSIHKDKNIIITDTYAKEATAYVDAFTPVKASFDDGTSPIRVIDLDTDTEFEPAVRINIVHEHTPVNPVLRVDPHPVWDRTGKYCVFNGHTDGHRRVFIADMSKYV